MIPDNCTFCGLCCTLTVRLSEKDIKRIEKTGRKRNEFVVADGVYGKPILNGNKNGKATEDIAIRKQKGLNEFFS